MTIEVRDMSCRCAGEFLPPSIRAYHDLWESLNGVGSGAAWHSRPDISIILKPATLEISPALPLGLARQSRNSYSQVDEQRVREIIALNQDRMSAKNYVCYHSEQSTERLIRLVTTYGAVGVATIDGRTCAGIICARVGDTYHMRVVAHDPRYDAWRLGKLCCYLSVCDAIEQGGKAYDFAWGRFDYKYKMLSQHKDLYRIERVRDRAILWTVRFVRYAQRSLRRAGRNR